jgi:hypothetical protein
MLDMYKPHQDALIIESESGTNHNVTYKAVNPANYGVNLKKVYL